MDNQMSEFSPCPKCRGEQRIDTFGTYVGLEYSKSYAIVCLSCGYVELYAKPETLEEIKRQGSAAAWEKSYAEAKARRAEQEQRNQAEKPQKKSLLRRFF